MEEEEDKDEDQDEDEDEDQDENVNEDINDDPITPHTPNMYFRPLVGAFVRLLTGIVVWVFLFHHVEGSRGFGIRRDPDPLPQEHLPQETQSGVRQGGIAGQKLPPLKKDGRSMNKFYQHCIDHIKAFFLIA